ncbi:hypothetical protein ACFWWP_15430, partial [Streptomyces sp. NPDC058695]
SLLALWVPPSSRRSGRGAWGGAAPGGAAGAPARGPDDIEALHAVLDAAQEGSALPDAPTVHDALHDLVVRLRLKG